MLPQLHELTVCCRDIFHTNAFFNPAISRLAIQQFTAQIGNPFGAVDLDFMDVFDRVYMPNLQKLSITMEPAAVIPVIPQTADLSQLTILEMRRVRLVDCNISFLPICAPNLTRLLLQSDIKFPSEGFDAKSWPHMTSMHLEAPSAHLSQLSAFPGELFLHRFLAACFLHDFGWIGKERKEPVQRFEKNTRCGMRRDVARGKE